MILNNLYSIESNSLISIQIEGSLIKAIGKAIPTRQEALCLNFDSAVAFPGLINSHDHLDFNIFPQLGNRLYKNYVEWGRYIHLHYQDEIKRIMQVPLQLRVALGIYKNLLCGVTAVVNHGEKLVIDKPLIQIMQSVHNLHSVGFDRFWLLRLNNPFKKRKAHVIHTGEGTDRLCCKEIDRVIKWNLLKNNLIGVHGVAMQPAQAVKFKGLVWCLQSNYFMFNRTADIRSLKAYTSILFGTDSTLTSDWNIWEHLRMALKSQHVTDTELLQSVTVTPAKIWNINAGTLAPGKDADVVIAKKNNLAHSINEFYLLNPEDILLVISKGKIRLFDESIYSLLANTGINMSQFSKIKVNFSYKYVAGNIAELLLQLRNYYPQAQLPFTMA